MTTTATLARSYPVWRPASMAGRALAQTRRMFEGPWFAVFMMAVLVFWNALLLAMMLMPDAGGALGEFTADFRRRCLEYDPLTGRVDWANAIPYFTTPLVLGTATIVLFRRQLAAALRRPLGLALCATAALGVVVLGGAGLVAASGAAQAEGDIPPFPAQQLRTALPAPKFELTGQDGTQVSPADFGGDVVLVTAIYTTCTSTCPMILAQARGALAGLTETERAQVRVIAVTMDPAHDTQRVLAETARVQGVSAPHWNLVTGEPARVNAVLDDMGVWRAPNPETGQLDHANVFLLIDRRGRLAYRFSLGEIHKQWLAEALRLLVQEARP